MVVLIGAGRLDPTGGIGAMGCKEEAGRIGGGAEEDDSVKTVDALLLGCGVCGM